MLQNFRPTAPDLQYLDRSIEQVEEDVKIMLTPAEIVSLRLGQTLHEGLQIIKQKEVSLGDILPARAQLRRAVRQVFEQIAYHDHYGTASV